MIPSLLLGLCGSISVGADSTSPAPPELGRVHFGRDVDSALQTARATRRPVFLLFQEIPGCATCRAFGSGPLGHPLIVEAIETSFVPVVIHNNRGGADADALARFREPAWNNPVVRCLGSDGRDLVPREEGIWSTSAVATRLVAVLRAARADVPPWLALARDELDTAAHEHVVFTMHCFWEGQARLGALDGVVDARPGFVDGAEVVDVTFVPRALAFGDLVRAADRLDCALRVASSDRRRVEEARAIVGDRARELSGAVRAAPAEDDLRRLRAERSWTLTPLTRAQRVRLNARLAAGLSIAAAGLSPRQLATRAAIETTLGRAPACLDGLVVPADPSGLGAYEDELARRINAR